MYLHYREEMTPLLEVAGGRFRCDFEVARTLKNESGIQVNRNSQSSPRSQHQGEAFRRSPILEIRARLFELAHDFGPRARATGGDLAFSLNPIFVNRS
jgi:hypothetical protein